MTYPYLLEFIAFVKRFGNYLNLLLGEGIRGASFLKIALTEPA